MNMAWLWQFPQNIVGRIAIRLFKAKHNFTYGGADVYVWNRNDGISLGKYIIVPSTANPKFIKHEYGHTVQSRYLGWFYLLVIGLPSLVWAGCFKSYRKRHGVSYYSFYTERWADTLGGVTRDD